MKVFQSVILISSLMNIQENNFMRVLTQTCGKAVDIHVLNDLTPQRLTHKMCKNLFYSRGIHLFLKYFTLYCRNLKWQLEISNVSNLNYTVTTDKMYAI